MSDVINSAISFRKKKALISSKAVGTIELEQDMLDKCETENIMKIPPKRKVTCDDFSNSEEEIKGEENLHASKFHSKAETNNTYQIQPTIALDFFTKNKETKDLLECLEVIRARCEQNVENFEESDKKDKYLNGYKVDKDSSTIHFPTSLQMIKDESSSPYSSFNDAYSLRFLHLEMMKSIKNETVDSQWQHSLLKCEREKCDYCKALKTKTVANSAIFQETLEDMDMYDLDSDDSSDYDLDDL